MHGTLGGESGPLRVLRREANRLGSGLEARVPALEITAQLLIERAGPDLPQLVGSRRKSPSGVPMTG